MAGENLLSFETGGSRLTARASGAWTSQNAGGLEAALGRLTDASDGDVIVDLAGITAFDTFGAWLLERQRRDLANAGRRMEVEGLAPANRSLLAEMSDLNHAAAGEKPPPGWPAWLDAVGMLDALRHEASDFLVMLGAITAAAVRTVVRPSSFRFTSMVNQFDRVGWQAVPIILMITVLIGAIIAQQGFFQFRRFGADIYVVNMIGFLIMREIGVLLVAIMVAGRTGSSYTAELGSMKMREEIDALKTMGFDPVQILVLPRVMVLIVALPALTFIGSMAALVGGGLVAVFYAGLQPDLYIHQLREAITMDHFLVGLLKAPFIGAVIGVIACNEGLRVRGSAASLGEHTTRSVVKSIFMIIVLDGLFALFFSGIGM